MDRKKKKNNETVLQETGESRKSIREKLDVDDPDSVDIVVNTNTPNYLMPSCKFDWGKAEGQTRDKYTNGLSAWHHCDNI